MKGTCYINGEAEVSACLYGFSGLQHLSDRDEDQMTQHMQWFALLERTLRGTGHTGQCVLAGLIERRRSSALLTGKWEIVRNPFPNTSKHNLHLTFASIRIKSKLFLFVSGTPALCMLSFLAFLESWIIGCLQSPNLQSWNTG